MNLVLDTNVMVESITSKSPCHKIFRSIVEGTHSLAVSNEIMLEYLEVFDRIYSKQILRDISFFFNYSESIIKIEPQYRFHLIHTDEDDNKLVDCAICGNCHFIITSDRHFDALKNVEFPKVDVISPEDFLEEFSEDF